MTAPEKEPRPSVSTAPAEGGSSGTASPRTPLARRRLPPHLGPARTSTVLLALAFVAVGVLYLFVKPDAQAAQGGTGTDPATTSTVPGVVPTTSAPPAATTEQPTEAPEETTAPTSEVSPSTSAAPEEGTADETGVPTTPGTTDPAPETSAPLPSTAAPSS